MVLAPDHCLIPTHLTSLSALSICDCRFPPAIHFTACRTLEELPKAHAHKETRRLISRGSSHYSKMLFRIRVAETRLVQQKVVDASGCHEELP
ncbi:hypothetical protein RRG08_007804 [Elysia crispata]|uniref:Uncharacterized protein n=1 Tax=Elysia crispata TaxID=231223 RepID=A0AAE1E0X3_9GAST|nr:hypothetical protein RRG08_007804 [Elysia crispata]